MKQRTLTNILLLMLLALNVAFIGSWWYGRWKTHQCMKGRHEHLMHHASQEAMFLTNKLGFDSIQQQQLEGLCKEHSKRMKELEAATLRNEEKLMNVLTATPADSLAAMVCADSVGRLKTEMTKEMFTRFNAIKSMCTAAQKTKFDTLVIEMERRFKYRRVSYHSKATHCNNM